MELCVSDELDEAVFVAFDMEMEKLANIQAAEAAQILVKISLFYHMHQTNAPTYM